MIIVSLMIAVWTSYITMEDIEAAFFSFLSVVVSSEIKSGEKR